MLDSPWLLIALAVLSLLCLRAWLGFFQSMMNNPGPADDRNPMVCRYGLPDVIFSSFLCLFFLLMILSDPGETQLVTRQILLNGMVFYASLVIAMTSFLLVRGILPQEIYGLWGGNGTMVSRVQGETQVDGMEPLPGTLRGALAKGLLWLALGYPILMLAQSISYYFAGAETPPQEILLFLLENPDFLDRLSVLGLALVVAPVAEEFIFRGYLYGVARKYGGRWCAIGTTSLLFAAIHLHAPSFAGLFLLGVLLALLYELTRRLWVPIVMHMTFNAVSVAVALFWPDVLP